MLRLNIRQLCGRCIQARTFSVARPLHAKNEQKSVEQSSASAGASTTNTPKETIDDVLRQSSKPIGQVHKDRPPVALRLFMNEVDEEMLTFPEVVDKPNLDKIVEANKSKISFYQGQQSIVDKNTSVIGELKKLSAFKHNVQKEYGGFGYSATESALASEPEGHNVSIALALSAHREVCSTLAEFGSNRQKEKYLPLLASGELIGTTCIHETQKDLDNIGLTTKAELDGDADEYILNGSKAYVVNSINSQLFLVFSQTRTSDMRGDMNDSLSAFLVDANAPGVLISKRDETIGSQNLYQSTVTFNNVRVKSENWLSIPGNGQNVLMKQIIQKRMQHGVINIVQMKNLLKQLMEYCEDVEARTRLLNIGNTGKLDAVSLRDFIARTAQAIYASESVVYLTAGITDLFENADIFTEATIVKIYTQERLYDIMSRTCEFLDAGATLKGHPMEEKIRDSIQLQAYDDPKDALKLFVGISGIQYCGQRSFEDVKRLRNPLLNPHYIIKFMLNRHSTIDNVELTLNTKKFLHMSLDHSIEMFEKSVGRLNLGVESLLSAFARDLPQQHCKILRLAEAAILNYVSMAALARASRAVCLKFESASSEHALAGLICEEHHANVLRLMKTLDTEMLSSYDAYYQKVAKMLIKEKKCFTEHPLTRYF